MREAAFQRYAQHAAASGLPGARTDFDARFPPGFFAHRAAFAATGPYGRWLLGKPLALRVNDTLFVHAGVGRALAGTTLEAINGTLRDELVEYVTLYGELAARGIVDATLDFYDVPAAVGLTPGPPKPAGGAAPAAAGSTKSVPAGRAGAAGARPAPVGSADSPAAAASTAAPDPQVRRLVALHGSMVHAPGSPLWYRGNVGCGPLIEQDRLSALLQGLGARRVVVGHTPTPRRQVWRRLDDRVWMIDTGMNRTFYAGRGSALVLEGGQAAAIYQGGGRATAVEALDERAGALSVNLSAPDLEAALAGGEIASRTPAPGGEIFTLKWHGSELQALFRPGQSPFPEVAAYRVDHLLDLAMVPAAVVRTVDGVTGSLQYVPQSLVTEGRRAGGDARIDAWCPLEDQWHAMFVFDAVIGNGPRTPDEVAYVPASGHLVLTGHHAAFGSGTGIPAQLQKVDLSLNGLWKLRLATLETPEGRDRLLEVLPRRQYEALVKRARALAAH